MSAIDVRTLYLAIAVIAGFFGIVFIAFHSIDSTTRGILQWGIAYLLIGVGLTVNIFRSLVHPVLYAAAGSVCFVFAAVLLDVGIRMTARDGLTDLFSGEEESFPQAGDGSANESGATSGAGLHTRDMALPILTFILLLLFLYPVPSVAARTGVFFLALAIATSRPTVSLIQGAKEATEGLRTALMTFAAFYTLVAATFVVLAALSLVVDPVQGVAEQHPMHTVLLPGLMLFLIGAAMSKLWVHYMRAYAEARRAATIDPLTGVRNRRYVMPELERMFQRAQREERRLACLMLDADAFKSVNDSYGHRTGDRVLKTLAQRVTDAVREYDLVGRYGGEEFLVVVPDLEPEDVAKMADRLHDSIRTRPMDGIRVTVSVGVAFTRDEDERADDLIQRADKALYTAKNEGRDRVVLEGSQGEGAAGRR